jgi:hypothetical protein
MIIYYAHPLTLYGSKQEGRDMLTLLSLGFTVCNPNDPVHEAAYKKDGEKGMAYFASVVRTCDALAFRGLPDGSVPSGVAKEIQWAEDKPIIELPGRVLRRTLTVALTREALREGGQR